MNGGRRRSGPPRPKAGKPVTRNRPARPRRVPLRQPFPAPAPAPPAEPFPDDGREPVERHPVRLHKIIAEAGLASRRAAERLIAEGAVTVNGRVVTEPGSAADPAVDEIRVSGQRVTRPAALIYLALNKPAGYVTTVSDEYGRATVLDLLRDVRARVVPVGRLDRETEGLLLLTNDGELTVRLTHPRYGIEKEYAVLVDRDPGTLGIERLRTGVVIEGRRTAPAQVERLSSDGGVWLRITIHEGRKRQVRLMCEALGLVAERLIRLRVGPIALDELRPGEHRRLTPREIARLRAAVDLKD